MESDLLGPEHPAPTDRIPPPAIPGRPEPSWLALRLDAASVAIGRRFARDAVSERRDDEHTYTITLLVSELLTNALRAAAAVGRWETYDRPVKLGVLSTERWVRLSVTDPDPNPIDPHARPQNGYGLGIVNSLAALPFWVTYAADGKTVHVAVAAPGITLTPVELDELRQWGASP